MDSFYKIMPIFFQKILFAIVGVFITIKLPAQTADFKASPDTACAPATISFKNFSTGNPTAVKWDFGDGRTSQESNPSILYNSQGSYTVSLTAYFSNGNTSNTSKTIYISPIPAIAFTANQTNSCKVPFSVLFTDNTPNPISRNWDFGDGIVKSTNSDTISHTYFSYGNYTVTLTSSNNYGCTSSLSKPGYINVAGLNAVFQVKLNDNFKHCIPLDVPFGSTVTDIVNETVYYQWDFGDGGTAAIANPTHTYRTSGIFDVALHVMTQSGCATNVLFPKAVKVGSIPNASIVTYGPLPGNNNQCASPGFTFTGNTDNVDEWAWNFGSQSNPIFEFDSTATIQHKFTDTGKIIVSLYTVNKGCATNNPATAVIQVNAPVANFSFLPKNCLIQDTMLFTDNSKGATSWQWDFGDGTTSVTQDPMHVFPGPGNYWVKLVASNNGGCSDTITKKIYVVAFGAIINASSHRACVNMPITFSTADTSIFTNYSWSFGDGTYSNNQAASTISKLYKSAGNYSDTLIVQDVNNCLDTIVDPRPVTVAKPIAQFSAPSQICFDTPTYFLDKSVPFNDSFPIIKWDWSFGDGNVSTRQNPSNIYTISSGYKDYSVQLMVTDNNGCTATATKSFKANPSPVLVITRNFAAICKGKSIQLNALSDGVVQWQPNYQLTCSKCPSPEAAPLTDTSYIVSATNSYGCSKQDTAKIKVFQPFTITTFPKTIIMCYGDSVKLGVSGGATHFVWVSSSSLNCEDCTTPIAKPGTTTTYYVTGYTNDSCFSVMDSVKVIVLPPPPLNAGTDQTITVGSSIQLNAASTDNIIRWQWSPPDYLSCISCANPVSTPKDAITYKVTATNDKGCTNSGAVTIHLICSGSVVFIPNTFTPNGDGMNDVFYPRGGGVKVVHYFRVFNRWGELVFERTNFNINDITSGWDGTYKGRKLPADVYIYQSEMVCDNNQIFHVKGNITLIR